MTKRIKPDDVIWLDNESYMDLILPREVSKVSVGRDSSSPTKWYVEIRLHSGHEVRRTVNGNSDKLKEFLGKITVYIHNEIPFWI